MRIKLLKKFKERYAIASKVTYKDIEVKVFSGEYEIGGYPILVNHTVTGALDIDVRAYRDGKVFRCRAQEIDSFKHKVFEYETADEVDKIFRDKGVETKIVNSLQDACVEKFVEEIIGKFLIISYRRRARKKRVEKREKNMKKAIGIKMRVDIDNKQSEFLKNNKIKF